MFVGRVGRGCVSCGDRFGVGLIEARERGMDVLVLSKADVARLLPLDACMSVMEETLKALSVLRGDQLPSGAHINAVGSTGPRGREIDTEVVRRARFFVDRLESTLNEAGDFLIARAEGAVGDGHILGELGDVLLGRVPGRRSLDEITLFRSLGLAVEDVATAHFLYREAQEAGLGVWAPLGGLRPGAE